jgi:ABC-2 type transport system ATP-binding protein
VPEADRAPETARAPAARAPAAGAVAGARSAAAVIEITDLTKEYGSVVAVNGISFSVRRGEVFGILGPNGAGKTTTLEMVEGLRQPTSGTVLVDGLPVWPNPKAVKARIGVQLQATSLFEYQTLTEIVYLFGSCYGIRRSRGEIEALLDKVGLLEKRTSYANQLSGGQAQRLSIALALVNDPVVSFLDEPTTGLDPRARRRLWDVITGIAQSGTTVVLTTHYMEEAERLCDRIAVMDRGRVMALDTPRALVSSLGAEATVTFTLDQRVPLRSLCDLDGANTCSVQEDLGYALVASDAQRAVVSLLARAADNGWRVENLDIKGANLEDVFLSMTGRKLGDGEDEAGQSEHVTGRRRRFRRGRV